MKNIFKKKQYHLPFLILKTLGNNEIILSLHKVGKNIYLESLEKTPDKKKDGSIIKYNLKTTYIIDEKKNCVIAEVGLQEKEELI